MFEILGFLWVLRSLVKTQNAPACAAFSANRIKRTGKAKSDTVHKNGA